jgi:hypothetical protein
VLSLKVGKGGILRTSPTPASKGAAPACRRSHDSPLFYESTRTWRRAVDAPSFPLVHQTSTRDCEGSFRGGPAESGRLPLLDGGMLSVC